VRMIDDTKDAPVQRLWLYLTDEEARALAEALRDQHDAQDADWHAHLASRDGHDVALSIAVYDPDHLPDDPRISAFLERGAWPS
jgi:hypothetical protein